MTLHFKRIAAGLVLSTLTCAQLIAAAGDDGIVPAAPVAGGIPTNSLPTLPGTMPAALPTLPATPGFPGAPNINVLGSGGNVPTLPGSMGIPGLPGLPGTAAAETGGFGTPPALTAFTSTDTSAPGTTTTAASTADTYEFLFYHEPEVGVVRGRFKSDVAKNLRKQRIEELQATARGNVPGANGVVQIAPGVLGAQVAPAPIGANGAATGNFQAVAEWDFYYEQLELYSEYVKTKLLGSLDEEDLPEVPFSSTDPIQDSKDLEDTYSSLANSVNNDLYNENREFYDRLEAREDRRRDFYDWLAEQQTKMTDWTVVWSRKINGERWTETGEVRRDDWYYGTNFGNSDPIAYEIDGKKYLHSSTPQDNLQPGQLNVLSTNLTPYDILDVTGRMKNTDMERLRGTLIVPPMEPVLVTTRTIELIQ